MSVIGDAFEIAKWLVRLAAIFPAFKSFWETVQAADDDNADRPEAVIAAALELERQVMRVKAKEEFGV